MLQKLRMSNYRHIHRNISLFMASTFSLIAVAWPPGLTTSESYYPGSHGPVIRVLSFGDSIASGFNSDNWFSKIAGGTYADHFGRNLSERRDQTVKVKNLAVGGLTTDRIYNALVLPNGDDVARADYIFLEGGGNDLLGVTGEKKIDPCLHSAFSPALKSIRSYMLLSAQFISHRKKPNAQISLVGLYYPRVNATKQRACLDPQLPPGTAHRTSLEIMALLNWGYFAGAKQRGFKFVDTFSLFNCAPADQSRCRIQNFKSAESYRRGLIRLDQAGMIRDPVERGFMQDDNLHPAFGGHAVIMAALIALLVI